MKSQKIQEMSNEALLKQKKIIETVTSMLGALLTVLLLMGLFLWAKKGLSIGLPFLVICLPLSPIVVINLGHVRVVKKELQTRHQRC